MRSMRLLAASAVACATLAFACQAQAASTRELGYPAASPFPAADCPDNCQAVAQVSGMQVALGSVRNPFRVSKPGYIVAWTVRLGNPNTDQLNFFKGTYGSVPQARLSVFKSLKSKHRYRLQAQSDLFKVEPYFGSTPTFVLKKPLRMHTNEILGLTVPTWVPAFAHGLDNHQAWRSSHQGSDCTATTPPQGAHQTVRTVKVYECLYRTARLLFSATFVPDPTPTAKKPKRTDR
jgi:hypothetical protein